MGRDFLDWPHYEIVSVSIHAPAWGATNCFICSIVTRHVSIHAPAWGATYWGCSLEHSDPSFNPRARMGRDFPQLRGYYRGSSFNPRARMGRDSCAAWQASPPQCFNPRARMGRDSMARRTHVMIVCFNPRARMGRDHMASLDAFD